MITPAPANTRCPTLAGDHTEFWISCVSQRSIVGLTVRGRAISTGGIAITAACRRWHVIVSVAAFRLKVGVPWAVNRGCGFRIVYDGDSRLGVPLVGKTIAGIVVGHGRPGHASVVRWPNDVIIVSVMLLNNDGGSPDRAELCRVTVHVVCPFAFPERSLGLAGRVVIGRGWSVALLTLMVPPKQVLQNCREEEKHPAKRISIIITKVEM